MSDAAPSKAAGVSHRGFTTRPDTIDMTPSEPADIDPGKGLDDVTADRSVPDSETSVGRVRRSLWNVLRVVGIVYLGIVLLMMLFENSLIFLPLRYPDGEWDAIPPGIEDVEFRASDGTRLHGWYAAHPDPLAVVLYAHGNAGNVTHRAADVLTVRDGLGCSVFVFDYRGYGKSEGEPDEDGVLLDGRAARARLAELAGVAPEQIVLFGRSLGTAVAVDLAADGGARGLVLYSGFSSLPDVAARHYPWLPVRWLMRTRFDSRERIADYHGPLLQGHSESDEVIPIDSGKRLFAAAPTEQKRWYDLNNAGHNDPIPNGFYRAFREFLTDLNP